MKHYFAHLVRKHEELKKSRTDPVLQAKEELRKAFSKEQLTTTLKRRLAARRQRDELAAQLLELEQQLLDSHGEHREQVEQLLVKIQKMKKKVEEKS
jgi:hypothetical protein